MTERDGHYIELVQAYAERLSKSRVKTAQASGQRLLKELKKIEKKLTPKQPTKKALKARIQTAIQKSDKALYRSLRLIYQNQTLIEAAERMTIHRNYVGFTAFDAELMTKFAIQLIERGFLSDKQKAVVRKRMVHYWEQLVPYARKYELQKKYGANT